MRKKFESICNNYINGNIRDARTAAKKLTKAEMLDFIEEVSEVNYMTRKEAVEFLKKSLEY